MKENTAKYVSINALAIALVCVSTMVIQIPIPLGYMHLGNTCILLFAALFGPATGLLAGGIGSALADLLTGYTQWVFPTLLIKSIMGFAIGYLANRNAQSFKTLSFKTFFGAVTGIFIMIAGYTIAGAIMHGSIYTGLAQAPGLTFEGVLGLVVFYVISFVLEKAKIQRILRFNV